MQDKPVSLLTIFAVCALFLAIFWDREDRPALGELTISVSPEGPGIVRIESPPAFVVVDSSGTTHSLATEAYQEPVLIYKHKEEDDK
jgi:hypothetical protein